MATATKEQSKGFEVVRGITIPHLDGKRTFVYPFEGPNNYQTVGKNLTSQGLYRPTMAEIVSLVYTAWHKPKGELESETIGKLKSNYLWAFNRLLWGKNGVYIADDNGDDLLDARNLSNLEELLKKGLKAGDPRIRFVPYDFNVGEQTSLELSKNTFMIGLAGK